MKILIVGVFNKPWSSNIPIAKEFKKINQEVFKFDYRGTALKNLRVNFSLYSIIFKNNFDSFIRLRLYLPDAIRNLKFYLFGNWRMNRILLEIVKKNRFDLIFLAKTDTINYKIIPKLNSYSKTWYFFMDPLKRALEINAVKYAALSTWSSASTTAMTFLFKKYGANSFYILEGFDQNLFSPGKENSIKKYDVIFVGSKRPDRKYFIDYLKKNNINIVCYGKGWNNKPVYLKKLVKKYRKSKIILNFPREDSGFSDRVFQSMGTGSFLLSRYCSDLERVFKKGVHLDWFETPEECLKLIEYYLDNEALREKISKVGSKYVLENFTWDKTVEKIIKITQQK